jgi:xanthine dehydrogenase YagR molybdenum-binding subunit
MCASISPYIGGGFGGKLFRACRRGTCGIGSSCDWASGEGRTATLIDLQQHDASASDDSAHPHLVPTKTAKSPRSLTKAGLAIYAGGEPETTVSMQTRLLYAGENRMTAMLLAVLDLPEGNAMRAPGEASGMMALEVAIDEMAEKLGLDPVEFRILNDTDTVPDNPAKPETNDPQSKAPKESTTRIRHSRSGNLCNASACRRGTLWLEQAPAAKPGQTRDGRWLIGIGVAAGLSE